ncbi:hypothetical protein CMV_018624 [Castanea mollissima]|uniref:Uncharacterized protein n=1 Tax=Castanea mollissima TaxID=60419 RepID=A0A8J4QZP7_9ROSI|nr:hypothetical protein CMV_018624 [Castanea mollissima]
MESDLSLLEISGEDDSLLLELPNDDASKLNSNNYFLCSPLQIHGSKPPRPLRSAIAKGKVGNVDTEKPSPSLQTDSISKENINANKVEIPKLNMEPQQMKRKKKGGGYNLRKSLAWDRAFFTEEGVLNPSELSMISGSFSKVGGGMLSIIPEEGRESLSSASGGTHNAADLQSLEVDLFKELPTSVKKDGKSGSRLLPKHGSPAKDNVAPASAAKRKVLATNDVNRNSSVFSRTTKSATSGANDSRRNQIAQPVSVQRKTGPKASSDSAKIVQNNSKSGPAIKSLTAGTSVRQARRKAVISASEKHPSTNLQHPPVTEANNSSDIIPATLLPSTSHTPDSHDGGGKKFAVTLPQNDCITGGQMQHAQLQKAKPSGLRMPSPSLGFFGQPKSSLHSPLQRTSRPYNLPVSNTSNLRKPSATNHIHDLRPPLHPGKISNVTTIGNMKVLDSSLGCSVPSTVNPASHNKQDEKMKSVLQMNNRQVEVKVPYDNKCYEAIKNQNQLDSILDDVNQQVLESAEPLKTEVIAHREESELQRAYCGQLEKSDDNNKVADVCLRNRDLSGTELENPPSISSLSCGVQDNGVSETKDLIDHQSVEGKPYSLATKNDGAFPGSNSGDVSGSSTRNISKANDDWLSSVHDVRGQSELMKSSTCEDGKISSESQRLWAKKGSFLKDNGASKEFLKFNYLADVSPKIQGCSEIALQSSHGQSCFVYMEQAKDDAGKDDKMSSNSLVGDAQAQLLEVDMLDATVKSSPSTSTVDSQYFMVVDDVNERIGEQLELCQTVESAILEANGACECKSNSSNTHCLVSPAMQDCSCGEAKTMACQHVKDAPSGSVNNKPVVENYNSSIDTQFIHNVELHGQFGQMEMEMRGEDHMTGTGCPKSGDFSSNELENPHPACRLSPTVQVNGGSGIDNVIQLEDVEEEKYNLLTKISSATSESQPGDDIGDSHCDTPIVPIDLLSDMHVVNEHFVEQTKLSMLCPVEADYEENQSPETYNLLSAKSQSSEGSMRFNIRTAADNSKVKISGESGYMTGTGCPKSGDFSGNELENPHPACCLSPTVQVNGGSGIDDVIQQEGVEEKKCNLLIKIPSATSESQPGDDIGGSHCDTSIVPIDLLSDMHVVNEPSVEQTKLSMLCPVEDDYEESHSPETYHSLLSAKSLSSEGSMRFNSRTAADNSRVKSSGGSGYMTGTGCPKSGDFSGYELENPHPACHLSPSVQVNGGFGIDDVTQQEDVEEKKCNLLIKIPSATSESQPGDDIGGCHCDTSIVPIDLLRDMHVVNEHFLEQTKLSMPCSVEADYEENQSPETYHSLLFAKSQSSQGSMRFNRRTDADSSEAKGSGRSGLESPHVDQRSKDVDGFNDMYKESNMVQSSNGKILVGSFSSNVNTLAASNQYLMVVDDVNDQSGHPELQNSVVIVEQVLLDNSHGLCLNDDFLLANTTSEELKKESAMSEYDVYGSKPESSMLFSEATPALQEDGVDADQKAEHLHMEDAVTGSVNIVPLAENLECCTDSKFRHDNGLSDQASLKFDSSAKMSTDKISGAVRTYSSKGFCSLRKESGLSILTDQSSESHNVLKSGSLSGEAETDISQICEMQQELDGVVHATDAKDATMRLRNPEDDNFENDKKQDALVIKPPPHAAPFSDEWLAAFESAGEEILTMKSGAVQHSPPDKSQPEPGPWSPVRRKNNQEIGPFDCTKYTNIPPSSSQ